MELNISRQKVPEGAVIADLAAELPLECDILLPDYYPDILKILRCKADIKISSAAATGGRIAAEGSAVITILYLSEDMSLCRNEQRMPFSKTFDFGGEPERVAVISTAEVENINCRAINQRRIDVRGAFALRAKVIGGHSAEVIERAEGGGVELCKKNIHFTELAGEYARSFSIREEGEIGYGKPAAAAVLRCGAMARVTECRVIPDKIITKGELSATILWRPEENEEGEKRPQRSRFVFPISQIIDAPGAGESWTCDARYRPLSLEVRIGEGGRIFEVEATIGTFARLHDEREQQVATDMYSTKYESAATVRRMTALRLLAPISELMSVSQQLELPEGAETIIDCWAELPYAPVMGASGALECKLLVCLLAQDSEGGTQYFERTLETASPVQLSAGEVATAVDVDLSAGEIECSPAEDGFAKLRCDLYADGCIYGTEHFDAMSDLTVDGERPKKKDSMPALTLYYADSGERIWDIAKRFGSSTAEISSENELSGDTVDERRMLMIPIV